MLGCCVVAALAYLLIYCYNKPARNVAKENAIPVTATELYAQFNADQLQANAVYLNKVLEVKGQVLKIRNTPYGEPIVVLNTGDPMFGVACSLYKLSPSAQPVKPGESITVKGICTGYVSHVVLSNCLLN